MRPAKTKISSTGWSLLKASKKQKRPKSQTSAMRPCSSLNFVKHPSTFHSSKTKHHRPAKCHQLPPAFAQDLPSYAHPWTADDSKLTRWVSPPSRKAINFALLRNVGKGEHLTVNFQPSYLAPWYLPMVLTLLQFWSSPSLLTCISPGVTDPGSMTPIQPANL